MLPHLLLARGYFAEYSRMDSVRGRRKRANGQKVLAGHTANRSMLPKKWVRQALRPGLMRRPFGQAVHRRIPNGLRGGLDDKNRVKRAGAITTPVGR